MSGSTGGTRHSHSLHRDLFVQINSSVRPNTSNMNLIHPKTMNHKGIIIGRCGKVYEINLLGDIYVLVLMIYLRIDLL